MTQEEKEAAQEARISGLAKAVNDNAATLDALLKKPSADPAKVESLESGLSRLMEDLKKLSPSSKPAELGFLDSIGKLLDSIFA